MAVTGVLEERWRRDRNLHIFKNIHHIQKRCFPELLEGHLGHFGHSDHSGHSGHSVKIDKFNIAMN